MKYLTTQEIEQRSEEMLNRFALKSLPIDVDLLAHRLGLQVDRTPLGANVSGVLVVEGGKGTVGLNQSHADVRQRFTLAHEIAHFVLHRDRSELFIDRDYSAVFRDNRSSSGEDRAEIQANQFAAALLMPRSLLEREIEETVFDLGDDAEVQRLATLFGVSLQSMVYRIENLQIFRHRKKAAR